MLRVCIDCNMRFGSCSISVTRTTKELELIKMYLKISQILERSGARMS